MTARRSPFGSRLPDLAGDRVVLRPMRPDELRNVATSITSDPEVSRWWSADAAKVRHWLQDASTVVYVVECTDEPGRVVGMVQGSVGSEDPDYEHAGIDIALFADARGKGIGPEVLRLFAEWLFTGCGFHRITIDPAATNSAAVRAYEKAGFKRIGLARAYERGDDGVWHDNVILDLLPGDLGIEPAG